MACNSSHSHASHSEAATEDGSGALTALRRFLVVLRFLRPALFLSAALRFQTLLKNGDQVDHLSRRLFLLRFLFDFFATGFDLLLDDFHERIPVVVLVFFRVPLRGRSEER